MERSDRETAFLRFFFVVFFAAAAAAFQPFQLGRALAGACGLVLGGVAVLLEARLRRAGLNSIAGACLGAFCGGLLGLLFSWPFESTAGDTATFRYLHFAIPFCAGYVGLLIGVAKSDLLNLNSLGLFANSAKASSSKLVDTSVLIDGRIADICESGFMESRLIIPQFVLNELQMVADSADATKRNRGRRGLDIVQRLQKIANLQVEISTRDFPSIREVDLKLIEMAKLLSAKIVTNDFNLNKLAQVQGLNVLNINELANALKPVVLPGESIRVFISKEGKEYNQGVAYLDDGTMVVVDNARRLISKTVDVTVTSVLQTTAGKMIFGKYDERSHGTLAASASSSPV